MDTSFECWECFSHSFSKIIEQNIDDEDLAHEIVGRLCVESSKRFLSHTPADIGTVLNKIVQEYVEEPFKKEKQDSTKSALEMFDLLKDKPMDLLSAVKIALFGNVLDFVVQGWNPKEFDINGIFTSQIAINHVKDLEREIEKAETILYLTDNAGEVVMDYFLIKYLREKGKRVILSPKEAPIQNDATYEDLVGTPILSIVSEIVPTAQAVGLSLEDASEEFKEIFDEADLVILKGMGYFENAFEINKNAFFLLKAKCGPVARFLGVNKGDNIVVWNKK